MKRRHLLTIPLATCAAAVLALMSLLPLLAACTSSSELEWKEDVRLEGGQVIVISRREEFKGPRELGRTPTTSYTSMSFEHPFTKEMIRYESRLWASTEEMALAGMKPSGDPGVDHFPYALMTKGRDVYVVTRLSSMIDKFFGCPDPPFMLYVWRQGRWELRPLEEIPKRRFRVNLTIDAGYQRDKISRSGYHLPAEEVQSVGPGAPFEFDFTGMTRQARDVAPDCRTCTMTVTLGTGPGSRVVGPFCTREQRDWSSSSRLSN